MIKGFAKAFCLTACITAGAACGTEAPAPYGVLPSQAQIEWQKMETNMFCHFGPNTFTSAEWGTGQENADVFNPTEMDCRQWASIAKAAGMKGIIITAKHHDGFCLWPNPVSKHTVAQSSWKDGKGDVLKELSEACREYGLNRSSAWYAMKYIERTGHWTIMEDMDIATRVMILPSRTELPEIEVSEPMMGTVLEIIMRKYTGVFSYPVRIDENYVASCAGITVPRLRQELYRLSVEHIIRYIPDDHSTIIYLEHDRLRYKDVNLMPERYRQLRQSVHDRIQTMVDYVTEDDECRSRFLLRYFGQDDAPACGTCDVCRQSSMTRPSYAGSMPSGSSPQRSE